MDIPATFALILAGLRNALAARAGLDRSLSPAVLVYWGRLHRIAARIDSLFTRWRAGTLPVAKPRAPRSPRPALYGPPAPRKPDPVPRRKGWIARLGWQERPFGGQIQALLSQPDMLEFLAAVPQAGRILRPLCRALEIPLIPQIAPPPRPPRVRRRKCPPADSHR